MFTSSGWCACKCNFSVRHTQLSVNSALHSVSSHRLKKKCTLPFHNKISSADEVNFARASPHFQQGTIHLSASSVGAASEMRARWRATNASTPGRSPMNVTAVGRSSASSTSWKPTTVCTQVLRSKQVQPRREIAAFIDVDDQRIGKLFVVLRGVMCCKYFLIYNSLSFCPEPLVWLSHGLPDTVCEQRFQTFCSH